MQAAQIIDKAAIASDGCGKAQGTLRFRPLLRGICSGGEVFRRRLKERALSIRAVPATGDYVSLDFLL